MKSEEGRLHEEISWKSLFFDRVRERNRVQRDTFSFVFSAYDVALLEKKQLETRIIQLEQELQSRSKSSSSTGGSTEANAALQDKISKLQEELTASYRGKSDDSGALVRANQQTEKDSQALLRKDEEINRLKKELSAMKEDRAKDAGRLQVMDSTVDLLTQELKGAQIANAERDKKIADLLAENKQLIAQLLKIKGDKASEMNETNQLVEELKRVQASRDKLQSEAESKIVPAALDVNDKNAILDKVAWESNFNVTVPGGRKRNIRAHKGQCSSLRYNAGGTLLATGGTDKVVQIYDAFGGSLSASLRGSEASVMNVCFSPNGAMVMAAGNDQRARIWSMKTARVVHTLTGHTNKIYAVEFTMENDKAITGSHDRTIKVWDVSDGRCTRTIPCASSCNNMSLSPDGNLLASAHMDNKIRFWSVRTGEAMHELNIHNQQATSIDFSRDGTQIVSNSRDNTVNIVDVRTFKTVHSLQGTARDPYKNGVNWGRACFSPDAQYVLAGDITGGLFVWAAGTGKLEKAIYPESEGRPKMSVEDSAALPPSAVCCVAWNRNGRQFASCDNSGYVSLWE